jgi:hypothetical protein
MKKVLVLTLAVVIIGGIMLISLIYGTRRHRPNSVNPSPIAAFTAPNAQSATIGEPISNSVPLLPDLSSPIHEEFLRSDPGDLMSLLLLYDEQRETDRWAINSSIIEIERCTGLSIPRGDVIDFEKQGMKATLTEILGQSWGSQTEDVRAAVRALQ